MHACFRCVAVQTEGIGVAGEAVHDREADAGCAIALEAEIVVCPRDGMVVLVDHEVGA